MDAETFMERPLKFIHRRPLTFLERALNEVDAGGHHKPCGGCHCQHVLIGVLETSSVHMLVERVVVSCWPFKTGC